MLLIHSCPTSISAPPLCLAAGRGAFVYGIGCGWSKTRGRDVAIQQMDNTRGALSLAEPGDGASTGMDHQALLVARDPVYYRDQGRLMFSGCCEGPGWRRDAYWHARCARIQPGSDTAGTGFEQGACAGQRGRI